MNEGDVILAALPQSDGSVKIRPTLCLAKMPPFQDFLVCGISTQLKNRVPDFDEIVAPEDADFAGSGSKAKSLIRLGFVAVLPQAEFKGRIGSIAKTRWQRLRTRLERFRSSCSDDDSGGSEESLAVLGSDRFQCFSDCGGQGGRGAFCCFSQMSFDLRPHSLDGIQVWRIGRQE